LQGSIEEQPKIIGPASTLKLVEKSSDVPPLTESDPGVVPKGKHWVDMADEGTVVVIEQPSGQTCAALGGIMATRMKVRGVEACIVGGRVRDLAELRKSGLPVSDKQTNCTSASRQLLWLSPFHHRMLSSVLIHFSILVLPPQSHSESPSCVRRLR
jgi:regulator of RNase E activity RraA